MTTVEPGPWSAADSDTISIDGVEWPGFATVSPTRANKWDDKKAKGEHIGERDYTGADAAKVTIAIKVWTQAQRDKIDKDLLPTIEPDPGKKVQAPHKVAHSVLTSRKISSITIDDIQGWERTSVDEAVLTIRAQEYRAASTTNATGKATGGGVNLTQCSILALQYNTEKALAITAHAQGKPIDAAVHETKALAIRAKMKLNHCPNTAPSGDASGPIHGGDEVRGG